MTLWQSLSHTETLDIVGTRKTVSNGRIVFLIFIALLKMWHIGIQMETELVGTSVEYAVHIYESEIVVHHIALFSERINCLNVGACGKIET